MSKLNIDVVYLIFQEFKDDKKTLCSCLLVNKTWCEIIIPILWKNPWKLLKEEEENLLLNVIISHLSDESRNNLSQDINFLTKSYQKPLFNYISFCRHLNFTRIVSIIDKLLFFNDHNKLTIKNEIFNLFINENTKFSHLYIPCQFNYQIHLIPGAKRCLSEIEFLSCSTRINDDVLTGLTEIINSIKGLELIIEEDDNNYIEIARLIETQKKLLNINLIPRKPYITLDEPFFKIVEKSLIKHANTIQQFELISQPSKEFLSYFVNLKTLELRNGSCVIWNCLENLSLPSLQILRARRIWIKSLASLIENTSGSLVEIKIDYISHDGISNKRIIQAIYKNCPNLKYLKLVFINNNILELKNLLIRCQHLNGLFFMASNWSTFDWDSLFTILTESSPTSLFKFKFSICSGKLIDLESLKLFFDNWKGRRPMLLQFTHSKSKVEFFHLLNKYKLEGVIKKYDYYNSEFERPCEDFEWI
ncbi:hypothetical protein C1645_820952 [Glomus cerebriforme]|uniref:F-box domain-containing protein n=1 Tax=Glomus cerebriforme TaxID=658196 RepID=A0A397TBI4_9GLOM|nr:hypothetical protein C1645_820952 [Glomus cerebriforme]